jgi:hypothetical protein
MSSREKFKSSIMRAIDRGVGSRNHGKRLEVTTPSCFPPTTWTATNFPPGIVACSSSCTSIRYVLVQELKTISFYLFITRRFFAKGCTPYCILRKWDETVSRHLPPSIAYFPASSLVERAGFSIAGSVKKTLLFALVSTKEKIPTISFLGGTAVCFAALASVLFVAAGITRPSPGLDLIAWCLRHVIVVAIAINNALVWT